jgi:hypothetical protein
MVTLPKNRIKGIKDKAETDNETDFQGWNQQALTHLSCRSTPNWKMVALADGSPSLDFFSRVVWPNLSAASFGICAKTFLHSFTRLLDLLLFLKTILQFTKTELSFLKTLLQCIKSECSIGRVFLHRVLIPEGCIIYSKININSS